MAPLHSNAETQTGEETQGPARAVNHRLHYSYSSAGQRGTEKCLCLPGLGEMHVTVYESVKALKTFLFETGRKKERNLPSPK